MEPIANALSSYSEIVLSDRPIGYWKLDEREGAVARDSSGNGHDGKIQGGVKLGEAGIVPGARSAGFDGKTGYIELPAAVWDGGAETTVEAWIKVREASQDLQAIVSSVASGEFVHLQLHPAAAAGSIGAYTDTGVAPLPGVPHTPLGVWRHIALVASPGNTLLYVDGQWVGTNPLNYSRINPAAAIRIASGFQGGRFFKGHIGEVAIYDHALPPERIKLRGDCVKTGNKLLSLGQGRIKLKSWQGDYLHRSDSAQGVTSSGAGVGTEWSVESIGDGKIKLKSCKGDYLHRPDSAQGVASSGAGAGTEWFLALIGEDKIKLKSSKGDYLHRPDSAQGVTTWSVGVGNEWSVEYVATEAAPTPQAEATPAPQAEARPAPQAEATPPSIDDPVYAAARAERLARAQSLIKNYVIGATGLGVVPLPLVDLAGIMALQVKLVHGLAKNYEVPFKENLTRSLVASLLSGAVSVIGFLGLASLLKGVPVLGTLGASSGVAITAGTVTYAVGKVFAGHFESGGTLLDFDPEQWKPRFKRELGRGKQAAAG